MPAEPTDQPQRRDNPYASPQSAVEQPAETVVAGACPLPAADQTRNLLIYAACMGLIYLCAPALYIGVLHAPLCKLLGANTFVSNLPSSIYFGLTFMPVILAWAWPYVNYLKRNLVCCFGAVAISAGLMAVILLLPLPDTWKIIAVIAQSGVVGIASPAAVGFLWEMIGRGVEESRRGLTLGLAFGLGPILAIAGSAMQTALLGGRFFHWELPGVAYPWGYASLYGIAFPLIGLAALLCAFCKVPLPAVENKREPFLQGVFGGFGDILRNRVLLAASVVTILLYAGNVIPPNMNLYAEKALDLAPEKFSGTQNMLRFSFKFVTGLFLGWLLGKTNPKAGVLVTGTFFLLAVGWAIGVTGPWYMVATALHGAGELVGVYAPNYILSASNPAQFRRNMAFVQMLMVPSAAMGALFGGIADFYNKSAFGFKASFVACGIFMLAGLALAAVALPARPRETENAGL